MHQWESCWDSKGRRVPKGGSWVVDSSQPAEVRVLSQRKPEEGKAETGGRRRSSRSHFWSWRSRTKDFKGPFTLKEIRDSE